MLTPEVREEIATLVRSGFDEKPRLIEIFCEEMYEPGELERGEVENVIDAEFAQLAAEREQWPAVTDCDRLNTAFGVLANRNIIALHNAGYTQSDGIDDFREEYARHPRRAVIIGYCYYHGQDVERAVRGGGLFLAFDPVDPSEEVIKGPEVGMIVREELERVGLQVVWNGTFAKRIGVPNFLWQKR